MSGTIRSATPQAGQISSHHSVVHRSQPRVRWFGDDQALAAPPPPAAFHGEVRDTQSQVPPGYVRRIAAPIDGLNEYRGQLYIDGLPVNDRALETLVQRSPASLHELVGSLDHSEAILEAAGATGLSGRSAERVRAALEERVWSELSDDLRASAVESLEAARAGVRHLALDDDACRLELAGIAARVVAAPDLDRAMELLGVPQGERSSVVVNLQQLGQNPAALASFVAGEHPTSSFLVETVQRGLHETDAEFTREIERTQSGRVSPRQLWTDHRYAALREERLAALIRESPGAERLPEMLDERVGTFEAGRRRGAVLEGAGSLAAGIVLPPPGTAALALARGAIRAPGQISAMRSTGLYEQAGLAHAGSVERAEAEFEGMVFGTVVDLATAGLSGVGGFVLSAGNETASFTELWTSLAAGVD